MEKWVQIYGYENLYEISDLGNIRSKNLQMKQQIDRYGYKYIALTKDKIQKKHKVHRLVLSSFIGDEPNMVCNHKDKNRLNNNLNNLEWVSILDNNIHKFLDKTKHVGITFKQNKWYSRIQINKKRINLGYYKTLQEAINARQMYINNNSIIVKY